MIDELSVRLLLNQSISISFREKQMSDAKVRAAAKKLSTSNKFLELVASYLVTKANAKAVREKVDAYKRDSGLLESFGFRYDKSRQDSLKPITDDKHLYMSDDDEGVAKYFKALGPLHAANGFNVPDDYCPALMAESDNREAWWAMEKFAIEALEMDEMAIVGGTCEQRDEFKRVIVGLAVSGPKGARLKLSA